MFKLLFIVTIFSTSLPVGGVGPPTYASDDCARAKAAGRDCSIDFEADDVEGDRVSPDGDRVAIYPGPTFDSLIAYREDFDDRVVQELDDFF